MKKKYDELDRAIEWWNYANFWRVIKFVESIYPRIPGNKDIISFWRQEGCPIIAKRNTLNK